MECLEASASSSTVASSADSRAMAAATDVVAAAARPRWKKALSLGSTTSTADSERCTDLDELDMEARAADGVLSLNAKTGVYSGWVHVAAFGGGFAKRFCRLEELVCKFYASAEDADKRVRPVARHVIISVRRVHARNKTFAFTDYEDRSVLLHTCMGADFELWFGTFAAIVKATQVAKSHTNTTPSYRRTTTVTPRFTRGGRRHQAALDEAQRLRALTAPMSLSSVNLTRPQRAELPPVAVDEDDPERTHTVWLYVAAPWWRKLLLRRQRMRRYFVFSGTTVSCFSVNKEGKRAMFTHTITSCSYDSDKDAGLLELECGNSHKKLRLNSNSNDGRSAVAATAKYIQTSLDYQ
ncbi:hypothetical protein PHYSODRAFT_489786 [Phytophthora sojae]|uniref:PH domain-containing protein n=1 Tax=Phytophthora sojae (strain P6497) TaxID=1094619 RepID=G4ZBR4_PHYSP|nr:hypothetical protein PHYSODRAFT_489786 [Phytophthora sojae]EGZ21268.1 hypothetical protein PHYSODRAFT_489786 [Phytophthora sojae]|eukprot:XP_009523985.1 hypothetical protein PHYSODRAFT_489786 [Phytophthora sojae]